MSGDGYEIRFYTNGQEKLTIPANTIGEITASEWFLKQKNPAGFLVLSAEGPGSMTFAMYKKPSRFKLFFYKWLLGWEWKNNQGV